MSTPGTTRYEIKRGVAVLTMDSPPVNSLSVYTRAGLAEGCEKAMNDPNVKAIVVTGAGRAFCAGAEISEFGNPPKGVKMVSLVDAIAALENGSKPVVAAIHGFALGGGLEVALSCHWRIADPSSKLGLPEVNLGLLPGAGGTQRLPRLVGAKKAAELIVSGEHISAKKALDLGVIDALVDPKKDRVEQAIDFALEKVSLGPKGVRPTCGIPITGYKKEELDQIEKTASAQRRGEPAVHNIVECVRAACTTKTFADGMKEETRLFNELMKSPEAKALQYVFFAERAANKIPKQYQAKPADLKTIGIIGSGTMGGGIAMCCADVGLNVIILDVKQDFLDRGLSVIQKNYETSAARGKITADQMKQRIGRIKGTLLYEDLKDCDMVIEAVFENMKLKQEIFAKLDKVCKKGALLCSNTSRLNIDAIADSTSRPEDVIGTHFFSPANVMRILENVLGKKSSPRTVSTAMAFGSMIGKVAVLVGNCDGFVANRMMEWYSQEAITLAVEGVPVERIDKIAYNFGFAMGPFAMNDLVGIDLFAREREAAGKADSKRFVPDALYKAGRFGQKNGKGFYDYIVPEGAKKGTRPVQTASSVVNDIIKECAKNSNIVQRTNITDQEIVERLFYPVINEGFKILEEGFAYKSSDIDMVIDFGYNFPRTKGGPMHYGSEVGLDNVLARLNYYSKNASTAGKSYWKASKMLEECVSKKITPDKFLSMQQKSKL